MLRVSVRFRLRTRQQRVPNVEFVQALGGTDTNSSFRHPLQGFLLFGLFTPFPLRSTRGEAPVLLSGVHSE